MAGKPLSRRDEDTDTEKRDPDVAVILAAESALSRKNVEDLELLGAAAAAAARIIDRANATREALKDDLAKIKPAVKMLVDLDVSGPMGFFRAHAGAVYRKKTQPTHFAAILRCGKIGRTIELVPDEA